MDQTKNISAEYLIAQYVTDPMRREPRNVGIILILGDVCTARFLGEQGDTGEIDGRSVKWMPYPSIYRKWIKYWREQLRKGGNDLSDRLAETNGDNYNIIRGGHVTDYGNDSAAMICEHLFDRLAIPKERLQDAVTETSEPEQSQRALEADIAMTFRKLRIMSGHTSSSVIHPILHNMPVSGRLTSHTPQFAQQNEHLTVMNSLNFSTSQKGPPKYRAGFIAKMFDDIGGHTPTTERIAVIHASTEDLRDSTVRYSLDLLRDSARIIKWNVAEDRHVFLTEREHVAIGDGRALV